MMTYVIYFKNGANRGSFAVDAITSTAGGDWTSSTNDVAVIENVENTDYMDEILNHDENVEDYKKTEQ